MNGEVTLRMATPADSHLPTYDFTKLSAINTCPRWGIIRYSKHLRVDGSNRRNMALEAGTMMHQCFSVIRLWQLGYAQGHMDLMRYHGERLFGPARWRDIAGTDYADDGPRTMALNCLASSGWEDDPEDRKRTYANLETSLLYYIQRWDHARYPVWIRDQSDPTSDVGIEIAFDMVVRRGNVPVMRYTGRVDGIHYDPSGRLLVQENKTASRINEAWRMAFSTSHQVTGYCVAAGLFTHQPVERAMVMGISIPLPRTLSDGLAVEPLRRDARMWQQWADWVTHTVATHDRYADAPLDAPMYTHACSRYFAPCMLIPLCYADEDEQRRAYDELVTDEWSPLEEAH